jgi:folate-dependent phosphoribosylglycinamide formyltransferase PurN
MWIAFFSQTGSEIVDICHQIKRRPNLIVTNNLEYKNPKLSDIGTVIMSGKHDQLMTYLLNQTIYDPKDTFITLHGYLRIIPPEVCNKYEMYNGHPALISKYPELKNKDPQERTWTSKEQYPIIGSVVHNVTPGVDEGSIVSEVAYTNRCETKDELYGKLKQCSLEAWYFFLRTKI